jgi:hypothetical protein
MHRQNSEASLLWMAQKIKGDKNGAGLFQVNCVGILMLKNEFQYKMFYFNLQWNLLKKFPCLRHQNNLLPNFPCMIYPLALNVTFIHHTVWHSKFQRQVKMMVFNGLPYASHLNSSIPRESQCQMTCTYIALSTRLPLKRISCVMMKISWHDNFFWRQNLTQLQICSVCLQHIKQCSQFITLNFKLVFTKDQRFR